MKIGFVILNYKTFDKAFELANYCSENIGSENIVVIVNNDPNDSNEISASFKIRHNLYQINANKNYGYAKGNNIGAKFLRDNLACEIIVILNPDVEIDNFNILMDATTEYFNDCNSVCLAYNVISVAPYYSPPTLFNILFPIFYRNIFDKMQDKKNNKIEKNYIEVGRFHGCAFAFKARTFNELGLLDEGTFLYGEELIAALEIKKNGRIIHLAKKVSVLHEKKKEKPIFISFHSHIVDSYSYILVKYFAIPRSVSRVLAAFSCYQINLSAIIRSLIGG